MIKVVSFLVLMMFSFFAHSDEKHISFGAQSETNGSTYDVGFCARAKDMGGKGPGHAFVVFRKFDAEKKVVEYYTAGLAPGNKSVPYTEYGLIKPETYSHPTQECLIASTSKNKYKNALSYAKSFGEFEFGGVTVTINNTYSLLLNDCVTYMGAVAKYFGLETPSRVTNMTPTRFVKALIDKY